MVAAAEPGWREACQHGGVDGIIVHECVLSWGPWAWIGDTNGHTTRRIARKGQSRNKYYCTCHFDSWQLKCLHFCWQTGLKVSLPPPPPPPPHTHTHTPLCLLPCSTGFLISRVSKFSIFQEERSNWGVCVWVERELQACPFFLLLGKNNTGTSFQITQVDLRSLGGFWHTWKFQSMVVTRFLPGGIQLCYMKEQQLKGSIQAVPMWLFCSDFSSCLESAEIWHADSFSVKKCSCVFFPQVGKQGFKHVLESPPPPTSGDGQREVGRGGGGCWGVEFHAILSIFFCILEIKNRDIFKTKG